MYVFLILGIAIGLVLVGILRQRIPRWKRVPGRLSLLAVGVYGFVPAILMRLRLVETTGLGVAIAIGYFFIFSVGSAVLLNGVAIRAARRADN